MITKKLNELLQGVDLLIKFKPEVLDYIFKPVNGVSYSELQGVDLLIKFKPEVLDYMFKPVNGVSYSEYYRADVHEWVSGLKNDEYAFQKAKQLKELNKRMNQMKNKTIAVYNNLIQEYDVIYKMSNGFQYLSGWRLNNEKWEMIAKQNVNVSIETNIEFCFEILFYYLLNPYIELPALDGCSNIKDVNSQEIIFEKTLQTVTLTANHHKYRLRRGVNILDEGLNTVYCSIVQAAKQYQEPYNGFYYDLMHGKRNRLKRIEKLNENN